MEVRLSDLLKSSKCPKCGFNGIWQGLIDSDCIRCPECGEIQALPKPKTVKTPGAISSASAPWPEGVKPKDIFAVVESEELKLLKEINRKLDLLLNNRRRAGWSVDIAAKK